jgi:S1-C subfamily serine protease
MNISRKRWTRFLLVSIAALLVAAGAAGIAYAQASKPAPIGTGIVVINTNLAYENGAAAGTGMVLTSNGEVLTNNHVISGATTIKVVVPKTGHSYTARVLGYSKTSDVAVLQLASASNLKTVSTSTKKVAIGAAVTAMGNAGGTGNIVSARGTVTGLGRTITASDDSGNTEQLTGLIETNAGVQPGDSGGPLVDKTGKVIGMDTAASASFGFQNVSSSDAYAIPIAKALAIARAIVAGNASSTIHVGATAFMGIQVQSAGFGESGVVVAGVVNGGPAATAGLTQGDTIVSIDGNAVSDPTQISAYILTKKPGQTISVTYADEFGQTQTATVTLASGPPQ